MAIEKYKLKLEYLYSSHPKKQFLEGIPYLISKRKSKNVNHDVFNATEKFAKRLLKDSIKFGNLEIIVKVRKQVN